MKFRSTRGGTGAVPLSNAIRSGAAPDGGLFFPERIPKADPAALRTCATLCDFAAAMLAPFFAGDDLESELGAMCRESFDYPMPLRPVGAAGLRSLELFHGPTGAFKDFGARFLMACFARLGEPLAVLTATSGDTGGAVGCAAEGREGISAFILYPKGRVSPFQELQLTCWQAPVCAIEVDGDFDDCQRLAKAAFADGELARVHRLSSANSINVGRLLPQMAYLAHAALRLCDETGIAPGLIIPTGNLGHAVAGLYARAMGLPIGPIVAATNANRTLSDWAETGDYRPRAALQTLATAMDVGAPSNFERLAAMDPELREFEVMRVEDDAIRGRIASDFADTGYVWCPHSATAAEAFHRLPEARRAERVWIVCATAHPYKFAEVVEPLIGRPVQPSPALAAMLGCTGRALPVEATLEALADVLRQGAFGQLSSILDDRVISSPAGLRPG